MKHNIGEWRSKAIGRFNARGATGGGRPINLCESEEMIIELLANNKALGRGSEKLNLKEVGDFLENRRQNKSDSCDESTSSDSGSSDSEESVNDDSSSNEDEVFVDEPVPSTSKGLKRKSSAPKPLTSKGMFFQSVHTIFSRNHFE